MHRSLQGIDEARIPRPEATVDEEAQAKESQKPIESALQPASNDQDDDEYDLALFRHSTAAPAAPSNATTTLTALASLESAKSAERILVRADLEPAGSSLLPSSLKSKIKDTSSLAEIRHLTLSETYKPTKGVEGHILAIAVQSAFTTSDTIKQVIIRLDPKLDKAFRSHALMGGFQIVRNDLPLESGLEIRSIGDRIESIVRHLWPLGFESEILLLDKEKWQMPKI